MPPYYKCRMCDKKMDTGGVTNTDIFFVKDKKGWYGREWECKACYMGRVVGPMTDRDSFRDNTNKAIIDNDSEEIIMGGYDPSEEER